MDELASQKLIDEFRSCLQTSRYSGVDSLCAIRERFQSRLRSTAFSFPESRELCDRTECIILSMANREIQRALEIARRGLCASLFFIRNQGQEFSVALVRPLAQSLFSARVPFAPAPRPF